MFQERLEYSAPGAVFSRRKGKSEKRIKIFASLIFTFLASFAFLFLTSTSFAHAVDLTVECKAGTCTISTNKPLFNETNIYPGYSVTYQVTAKNNNDESCTFAIELDKYNKYNETGELGKVINIYIDERSKNHYSGTLSSLNAGGYKKLSDINGNDYKIYDFTAELDGEKADNNYQNKKIAFDIKLGFKCGKPETSLSSSPGDDGKTTDGGTSGAGDTKTDTYTLTDYTAYTTGIGGYWTYAPLEGDVEGVETGEEVKKDEISKPEIKGEKTCDWWHYLWWLPLVIQVILTGGYYYWLDAKNAKNPNAKNADAKNAKIPSWWLMPIILAVLSQIVHEILGCECVASKWCPCYWLFNLTILFSLTTCYIKCKKNQSSDLTSE